MNFDDLPYEIQAQIFEYLSGNDLAVAAETCRRWATIIITDNQEWFYRKLCESGLNSPSITPSPYKSYFDMYRDVHSHFWLHDSLWIGDKAQFGSLVRSAYNKTTGRFDIVELRLENNTSLLPAKLILSVGPKFSYKDISSLTGNLEHTGGFAQLVQTQPLTPHRMFHRNRVWPPMCIPASTRCLIPSQECPSSSITVSPATPASPMPLRRKYEPTETFRIKSWISFARDTQYTAHIASQSQTFARLNPDLYTPVEDAYPYRGLWAVIPSRQGRTVEQQILLFHQESNRLEAIKLTGDRFIPRGEVLFTADIASDVSVLVASRSKQTQTDDKPTAEEDAPSIDVNMHISDTDYMNSRYIQSSIILVDRDTIVLDGTIRIQRIISNRVPVN